MIGIPDRSIVESVPINGTPANNFVLIKVILTEKQRSKSGLFMGDASWAEAEHITRHGIVVALPPKVTYQKDDKYGSEWLTDMEVSVGDHVWYGVMAAYDSPVIKNGEDYYFLIKYWDLIVKKTDDGLVPLNGYIIAEKVIETMKSQSFSLGEKFHKNRGVVRYIGSVNKEYNYEMFDAVDVRPGDTTILLAPMFTMLEDERYAILPINLGYFQRRWITMIIR